MTEVVGLTLIKHQAFDVIWISGSGVAEAIGNAGRVSGIRLLDGLEISAQIVIVGIGVDPNGKTFN